MFGPPTGAPASISAASTKNAAQPGARRNILLLQGLMGPFFQRLGTALREAGHEVYKVNFNGGDRLFWRLPGGSDYRGSVAEWPEALTRLIAEKKITDVMLFGDCRPLHVAAKAVCRNVSIPVHVFEEGYIRPDWVTLELGGVNGHSALPSDPNWYLAEAAVLPHAGKNEPIPSSFRKRALEGLLYNAADVLTRWHYPFWQNHRPWHPLVEGMGWARRLLCRKAAITRAAKILMSLRENDVPYFLFPLQLDSDAQIRLHSPFAGIGEALRMVLKSFATCAPKNMRLVVKEHPLDNGIQDWRRETILMAELCGVGGRVDYLEGGDIAEVALRAKGMVTINSTSGTLALALDIPVIVLGDAVYDIDTVTFQGKLDDFWCGPARPDSATFAAFRRVLIERCLIAGGFFSEEGITKVVAGVIARFDAVSPIAPVPAPMPHSLLR